MGVAQELADQGQPLAIGEASAGKGMAQLVYTHIVQTGLATNTDPGPVKVRGRLIGSAPVREKAFAAVGLKRHQEFKGRLPDRYALGSRLGVPQAQQTSIQIELSGNYEQPTFIHKTLNIQALG